MKARGLQTKRTNLAVAALCGAALAAASVRLWGFSWLGSVTGFLAGLVYANGFEYCLHRFILHAGRGLFFETHMLHHTTVAQHSPEEPQYVNFSHHPLGVVGLFVANAIPFLLIQLLFPMDWTAGMFVGFGLYYIAFEEIHWRSHMGGWLPKWLHPAARHHVLHHHEDTGRFNVFFPLFDWLARSSQH